MTADGLLHRLRRLTWDEGEAGDPAEWLLPDGDIHQTSYHDDVRQIFTRKEREELDSLPYTPAGYFFMRKTGAIRIPAGEEGRFEADCLAPRPTDAQVRYMAQVCREVGCWWDVRRGNLNYESGTDSRSIRPMLESLERCRVG
jgi:hypothetical protein